VRLPPNNLALNEAVATLNRMLLARAATQFDTNFDKVRSYGAAPQVWVWIPAQDELSLARMRKRVREALSANLKGVAVTVYPDPSADAHEPLSREPRSGQMLSDL
jgi:plasmid maintenance system antidote protein VapI